GPRIRGRIRRQEDQQPPLLASVLLRVPARAPGLSPAAFASEPRPRRASLLLRVPLVLQPRERLHERAARLSAASVPARALCVDRRAGTTRSCRPPALEADGAARGRGLHHR